MKKIFAAILPLFFATSAIAVIYRHDKSKPACAELATQPRFDCVGQLLHNGRSYASCVLIGEKYVLTAAHCFKEYNYRADTTKQGDQLFITNSRVDPHTGNTADYVIAFSDKRYRVKKITVLPGAYNEDAAKPFDLALLELEEPITGVTPAILNTATNELNANVEGAGYGATGPANEPGSIGPSEKKLAGENVVDSFGGPVYNGLPSLLICDMDDPSDPAVSRTGSATPRPLEYIMSGGDSGGGLFRQNGKKWELVGVGQGTPIDMAIMRKTGYYGQLMTWTRIAAYHDWILNNMK